MITITITCETNDKDAILEALETAAENGEITGAFDVTVEEKQ